MYLYFSFKKIVAMGAVLLILGASIWATFLYKDIRFGTLHPWQALSRTVEKNILLFGYGIRYVARNGFAFAATMTANNGERKDAADSVAIPVLLYHTLPTQPEENNVEREVFFDHMTSLKAAGWKTISLKDLELFLRGEKKLPARSFLLTFDDGARDSYYPSDPILSVLGYNAVSFILPKYSTTGGTHYYLSEGEIRTMLRSGRWEIGSHGQNSHEILQVDGDGTEGAALANRLWLPLEQRVETHAEYQERIVEDLRSSRQDLETEFGIPITAFAFPFGEFGQLSLNNPNAPSIVERSARGIYDIAFYQTWEGEGFSYNYPALDYREPGGVRMVKRIDVSPDWSGEALVEKLERGYPKNLMYSDTLDQDLGWSSTWGEYEITEGELRMHASPEETGAAVILDGTGHLTDYQFNAKVVSKNRTGVLLWARLGDNNNNAACNFGNGFVHAEDTVRGSKRVINGVRGPSIAIPEGEFTLSIRVDGRTIGCYMNGEKLVETPFLDPSLSQGGVGIKVWDAVPGRSSVVVKEVVIEPLLPPAE